MSLETLGNTQDTFDTFLLNKLHGEVGKHLAREHRTKTGLLRDLR